MRRQGMSTQGKVIIGLILAVVVLLGFVLYMFALKPTVNGYVVNKQVEAQTILLSNLIQQVQQNGYVQIPVGEDQVLTLIPYTEPAQDQTEQPTAQ